LTLEKGFPLFCFTDGYDCDAIPFSLSPTIRRHSSRLSHSINQMQC
jgi:hypothetical protein